MIRPGEIYWADTPPGQRHKVVVVSREDLNRGKYVVVALITSQRFATRSQLANCVPLLKGQFGMTEDCVVQGEMSGPTPVAQMELTAGPLAVLDDLTVREVIRAIGHVMDADCEPC
jgi:mRNA-degrading endonuclease toxin of MazEF toxin-antitoxin module